MGKLIVQKYGGSSVADVEKLRNVARRVIAARGNDNQVVVVASAMGDTTDDLIELAHKVTSRPDDREMDLLLSTGEIVSSALLAMTLKELGCDAISLTGFQAGIRTTSSYSKAKILNIDAKRISEELDRGKVVIVAGFQGITDGHDITTLGRGGSDTTAVALAASLGAEICELYKDVEGVYTADPRLVPDARKMSEIGYQEMLELASSGDRVIHSRAVELAELFSLPILVASSFVDRPGTLIHGGISMEERNKIRGIAHDSNVAKITIVGVPDRPGIAAAVFEPLAKAGVSVDTIVQNASAQGITDLTFTVGRGDLDKAMSIVRPLAVSLRAKECLADSSLAKISIVGTGMQDTPGYAAGMFHALAEQNINIQLITTSEIRITCIIAATDLEKAAMTLHGHFQLDRQA